MSFKQCPRGVAGPSPFSTVLEPLEPRQMLHAALDALVNFQPASASVPSGYLVDSGGAYGTRGGLAYGWNATNGTTRDRNKLSDQSRDTLIHMQSGSTKYRWDMAVANGNYKVTIVAGDAGYYDSVFRVAAEGVTVVSGTPTSGSRFVTGTAVVAVTDGKLTLTSASGAVNNKLNWVRITATHDAVTGSPTPTKGWESIASSPIARTEQQLAVINGKMYVFGGYYDRDHRATTRSDVYDPAKNTWTRIADMPAKITHAATVVRGSEVWFVGGYVGDFPSTTTASVWKYNVSTNAWSRGPSLPQDVGAGGAVVINNKLIFTGGVRRVGNTILGDVGYTRVLDLNNQSAGWQTKASLPNPRNHVGVAVVNGLMYVLGGQKGNDEHTGNQSDVHAYNPATNTWAKVSSLPAPRGHFMTSTFVDQNRIYTYGGTLNGDKPSADAYSFDPASKAWTRLTSLPEGRKSPAVALINGYLYVIGGGILASDGWVAPTSRAVRMVF